MSILQAIEYEEFYHVFQPIFETNNWGEIGYEALLRTKFSSNPEIIFQKAKKEKQLFELDSRSIQKAVRTYFTEGSKKDGYLFVNIFPSTIIHPNFPSFLKMIIVEKDGYRQQGNVDIKIVFEILESEFISDSNLQIFKERVNQIKEDGFLIAIDDIGKGFNALPLLIEIDPNFLKLDRYFSKDLVQSKQKQSIIDLLNQYCEHFCCKLILEGVEKNVDLDVAKLIGVRFIQGYLLGRPGLLKERKIEIS